jgi:hypothetical protein
MLGSDQMRLVRAFRNAGIRDGSISLDLSRSFKGHMVVGLSVLNKII